MSNEIATFATNTLSVGNHTITAAYAGSAGYASSASGSVTQTVNEASTALVLTSSLDPSAYQQGVTFSATVTAVSPGSGTPTGNVTFTVDGTTAGSGALGSNEVATWATSTLAAGAHTVAASYGGDGDFLATSGTPPSLTQTVLSTTNTALSVTPTSSVYGQSVTLSASVTVVSPGTGTPSGSVTFYAGGTQDLGTATLSGGAATLTTAALSVASQSITADYGGSTSFAASTSSAVTESVTKASSQVALSASANPSVFGQSVTFTVTVSAAAPGAGTPRAR